MAAGARGGVELDPSLLEPCGADAVRPEVPAVGREGQPAMHGGNGLEDGAVVKG